MQPDNEEKEPAMSDEVQEKKSRGRGIGTVIACFAAAIAIAAVLDDDHKPRKPSVSIAVADDEPNSAGDGRTTYKINKGHVVVNAADGAARVEMDPELKDKATISTQGKRTTISVDDSFSGDAKIRIHLPKTESCRIELGAGFLEVEGLPCAANELTVRSGKMDVNDVPKVHGALKGEVSVGMVTIRAGEGSPKKSAGVGELRAEAPATGDGPGLTARVDVGMLTVDVE
jgi:hypothetical protein